MVSFEDIQIGDLLLYADQLNLVIDKEETTGLLVVYIAGYVPNTKIKQGASVPNKVCGHTERYPSFGSYQWLIYASFYDREER